MNKMLVVGFVSLVGFLALSVSFVSSLTNTCVVHEAGLKAQLEKNEAVYDTAWKTIAEVASVANSHSEKVKEIVIGSIQGRYSNSENVLFQAISEANGQALPTDLYAKVQVVIEANRNQFLANQVDLVSRKQSYEVFLNSFPNVFFARVLGFPRVDLDKFKVVTSSRTDAAFSTSRDDNLFIK